MMFDNDQPTLRNGKSPTIDLPQADSSRWQPLRSGLLNIYRYDNQEFHFERGHLLLRGNNGTGKSRVLALQLPFLFDADVSPHRVEPDGDSAKRIEWNLLMGKHPQRLGYTWLEFGRKDANGTCHYLTLGIGLNAIEGRGAPTRWHFITRQRISRDLLLHNERDEPLTHERLIEAIGMHGNVYETAREYRRAVDMELFKLGEHRYRSLIDLLIQLRQPQLARDLDDKRMSAALSEALSPVDGRIIADVAESFRSLEKDQHELRRAESASEAVDGFLSVYGPYTKIAARRRADVVRAKHADYESAMRRLRDAEAERKEGARQLGAIETQIKQLDADEQTAIATADALANSPQMRDARELEAARQTARERAADAERQRTDCNEANQQRQSFNDEHTQAHVRAKQTWREVEAALAESKQRASNADLTDAHHQAIDPLGLDNVTDIGPMKTSAASLQNTIEKRRVAIHHLNQLNIAVDQAERELTAARQAQIEREGELTEAIESQRAAHVAAEQQASALLNAVRTWRNNLIELKSDVSETLDESLETWCETGEGRSPLAVAIELASDAARQRLTITRAEYEQSLRELNEELTGLRQRRQALLDGKHEPPPRPHTRSDNARRDQRGAAFWSLVDFAPSLNAEQQANIEAALESAGLLDAWVTSDGLLIDGETHDTLLDPRDLPLAPDDRRLCRWLIPDEVASTVDRSINSEIIQSILMVIGAGIDSGSVWINDDGSWRNGPLHGRWSKPLAQHIGQSARQRNREQQIAHLNELIDVNDHAQELTQKSINVIVQRLINVTAEVCSAPTDEGVRQALAHVGATAGLVVRARSRVVDAELIVRSRLEVTNRTVEKRDQDASDFGLQNWVKRLLELQQVTLEYRESLTELWSQVHIYINHCTSARDARARLEIAIRHAQSRQELLDHAERLAREAQARSDTLQTSVGAAAKDVMLRLEQARQRVIDLQKENRNAVEQKGQANVRLGVADHRITTESENLARHQTERALAIESLIRLVKAGLLGVAIADLSATIDETSSVTRALELARSIETSLGEITSDTAAWDRHQSDVHRHVQQLTDVLLPHDLRPQTAAVDDLLVVSVLYQQQHCSIPQLREGLADDIIARRTYLEERERQVLEETLIGEVATHLHERIRDAERLVHAMNQQIEQRPMSTGMRLRFRWDPIDDGPSGLAEARKRLLRAGEMWSPEDRKTLGDFLHEQINASRLANEARTWQQHLEEALDYRRWHHFGVERHQDGKWQRLNKRTHGTGSGGEKAVALTLPMFAAASAHYHSADPHAPRPILLDEVFAGIDPDMRSKCMGLLDAFDLDFIMTSDREWGCYATMPGVAIYQLTTTRYLDAVLATRWVWNGRSCERVDHASSS